MSNKFQRISLEEGLSQSVVYSIIQDSFGFMWFTTQEGLNRYDGYNFKIYKHNPHNYNSIPNNYITSIYEDSNKALWIGGQLGNLSRYDRDNDCFENFNLNNNSEFYLSEVVHSICEDTDGCLLIGTLGGGLKRLDNNKHIEHCITENNSDIFLNISHITSIVKDDNGKLWIGSFNDGLFEIENDRKKITNYKYSEEDKTSISHNRIYQIYQDSKDKLWIGTRNGLNIFDKEKKIFNKYFHNPSDNKSLSDNIVRCFCEDKSNNIWIGTKNKGLNKFIAEENNFINFRHDNNNINSISHDIIYSLYSDNSNVLWIGTFGGGINNLNLNDKKFHLVEKVFSEKENINVNYIHLLTEDKEKNFWVGTYHLGLFKLNWNFRIIKRYLKIFPEIPHELLFMCSYCESENTIWFGSTITGLIKYEKSKNNFKAYPYKDNESTYSVYCLCRIQDENSLWVGTDNFGLAKFDLNTETYINYNDNEKIKSELKNIKVRSLFPDGKNILWIGTFDSGLFKYDIIKNELNNFISDAGNVSSISDNNIISIIKDSKNRLWIGTYEGGLNRFIYDKGCFENFTIEDGLPNNMVKAIAEDSDGNLWMSTNNGLSRYNPEKNTFRNFDESDGLQSREFNDNTYFISDEGRMYFGGINGFNYFNPQEIFDNLFIPNIVITDFKIFNETVKNSVDNPFLKKNISETSEINLTYRESVISFEFAALIYNNPKKNEYAYKMEGFDKEWVYCGTRRQVTYTNLNPGEYIFRVKGSNNDGVWNEEGTSLKINISPPFWKTWWFKSLGLLSLAGATSLAYQQKLSKVKKENKLQREFSRRLIDTQEKERKDIASELHDTIAHDILITKNRIVTGMQQTDDIKVKSMLNDISELSTHTLNDVRNISHNLSPHILEELGLTKAIKSIIRKVTQTSELIFTESIDNIDDILSRELEINIYRIIQECINNIFKHSGATEANLKIIKENEIVKLIITDNGKGISEVNKKGFGMKGLNERVKLYNGNIVIDSARGTGTGLTISFPLKNPNIK